MCLQVCEDAGVELHTVPLTKEYWDRVVSHSIAEIKAGRTPNPDVLCNSRYACCFRTCVQWPKK